MTYAKYAPRDSPLGRVNQVCSVVLPFASSTSNDTFVAFGSTLVVGAWPAMAIFADTASIAPSRVIDNIKPRLEVRSKRVGGATYQVPREVNRRRQNSLAIRWLVESARTKRGKPMARRLADEIFDAYNNQGVAVTKRENVHKMAEANSAYSHFAW